MHRAASRRGSFILSTLILFSLPAAAVPQECETALREAERLYDAGRLEDVPQVLAESCLREKAPANQKAKAYELLAKTYLALDRTAKARANVESLLAYDATFKPGPLDPIPFRRLVEEVRKAAENVVTVASVSKTDEPLNEAPATVAVVTAEQIARRGYVDLEQVFYDLPGFDISRSNGPTYSNLYQRGFRSNNTDRTLFLVDGVEQNDLWSNIAYISRQYPLSNIDRIEVVYGPVSTIYGPNAYAGVINVITKRPAEYLAGEGDRNYKITGSIGAGSLGTSFFEANLAGRNRTGNVSYSITGRLYRSDERDLSQAGDSPRFADWNLDPADLDGIDYEDVLTISGLNIPADSFGFPLQSFFYETTRDPVTGNVVAIVPTELGVAFARFVDQDRYQSILQPSGLDLDFGFSEETDDWSLSGKLNFPNLELGFQAWRREEGTAPAFSDLAQGISASRWTPRSFSFYLKYAKDLSDNLSASFFSRYKLHELDDPSNTIRFRSFSGGDFRLVDFEGEFFPQPIWVPTFFSQSSTQIRNELTFVYRPSPRFNLVSGIELRNSSIQADLDSSATPPAAVGGGDLGSERLSSTDAGLYVQSSYKPWAKVKIVAGGRIDHNDVRETGGYGTVFNPRIGVMFLPGNLAVKAIYSEAFKDPSNAEKFGTVAGLAEARSTGLDPERVSNLEVSLIWQRSEELWLEIAGYDSVYSNVVALRDVPNPVCSPICGPTGQQQNLGELKVRGIQLGGSWKIREDLELFGNYNFTDPVNTNAEVSGGDGTGELRIADIASHRFNLGLDARPFERLDVNLRMNYVDSRRTGRGTTVATSPLDVIGAYTVFNVTLTYQGIFHRRRRLDGSTIQLLVTNVFDEEYDHPGVAQAGRIFAARLPQNGRSVFLRLTMAF